MLELLGVAFLGGFITGVSPCIVPVLPVVLAGGTTSTDRRRPFLIIAGLVVSFSLSVLLGTTVLSALDLPQNLLDVAGFVLLLILAVGLMIPPIGALIERPFARLGASRYAQSGGGFGLGLSLGLVFVPCAGPVLGAISTAAANHRISASSLSVTLFYAIGAALPLLFFAVLAQRTTVEWGRLREHLPTVRRVGGIVLAVTAFAIHFGWLSSLQTAVPGYTSALEDHVESSASITNQLRILSGEHANTFVNASAKKTTTTTKAAVKAPSPKPSTLPILGTAPNFAGIVAWLNTPDGRPLTMAGLRGKVVLIDFWTYSCINCQRSLPHVEAWYKQYKKDGLVVVGVHSPEFAFEHVVSNVKSAAASLGVRYPVAVDSNLATWDAWGNEYWPAEYLVDPQGRVRAYSFGEGDYSTMESNIRSLLTANGVTHLPPRTDVANKTPTQNITQESYIGYKNQQEQQSDYEVGTPIQANKAIEYTSPKDVPINSFSLNGKWIDQSQQATALESGDAITLHFSANDAYLVMGGKGTVGVTFNGRRISTLRVQGIPKLYTLYSGKPLATGDLKMTFTSGVQAYDFTFG